MSDVYIRDPEKDLKYSESSGEYVPLVIPGIDNIDDATTVRELEVNSTAYNIVGKGVLDQNSRVTNLEWIGTKAEYEALGAYSDKCTYIITDDSADSQSDEIGAIAEEINTLKGYDYVVDWQEPTSDNGYTWYRKYKSGWIEQGGEYSQAIDATTVTFPIAMNDTNYVLLLNLGGTVGINDSVAMRKCVSKTTTSIVTIGTYVQNSSTHYDSGSTTWYVCGMAA